MARRWNSGEIELRYDAAEGSFSAWYFDHRLPIAPERYSEILRTVVKEAGAEDEHGRQATFSTLASRYAGLAPSQSQRSAGVQARTAKTSPAAPTSSSAGLRPIAPARGAARNRALHRLLERQHYRLAHWRLASSDINYRRFFDINNLAGLRVEDAGTFDAMHELVAQLIAEDKLQGLRLDHIDGLRDPAQYSSACTG